MAEQKIYDETYIVYSPWNGGNTKHISLDSDADESVLNEFTITTDANWITLSDPTFTSYIKDTNGARVCMADFKWSVGTNESRADRVGTICITRSGELSNYIVNIQVTQWGGILSADEIPEDAYKEIVPGVTPWFTTIDSKDFPEFNIGRAEKVIYEPNNFLRNPSAVLCIPGATEHTRAHLIKIFPEFDNDKLNFRSFSAGVNPYQDWAATSESTKYPGFKTAGGIGIGVSMSENFGHEANVKGISYKTIKLIFYVENYDNQIGNYIAIPVQYVLCKDGLIKEEFDKIVEIFGPANYDGTMHDLHKFDFTPKEISPKYTPWVSTRNTGGLSMTEAGTNKYYEDETYGRAEKVLYMSCDNMTGAEASIFVPGKCDATKIEYYVDVDKCVNMKDPANDLWLWDNGKDNGWWDMPIQQASSSTKHYGIKFVPSSNFLPDHIGLPTYQQNHRSTVINFVVHDYCRSNSDYFEGNAIVIPFRIVQCKSGITKAEFDELVKIYGPSNYDGTMNNLDAFGFGEDDTETEILDVIPGTTAWVEIPDKYIQNNSLYPFDGDDCALHIGNYGKADKVLYVPNILSLRKPSLNVYIPKSCILDDTSISVSYETNEYNPSESRLSKIFDINAVSGSLTNWTDSTDYPNFKYKSVSFKDIRLYSTTSWQSDKPAYCKLYFTINNYGEAGKQFVIPFTLVCFMEEAPTKTKFNETVNTYGSSNYDGTMQNLDMFHFDKLDKNPYLKICDNCNRFSYDSNSHMCSECDYSDMYAAKSGLPYFANNSLTHSSAEDFFSKNKAYIACNHKGTNGGEPDGFPGKIIFPANLGITDYSTVNIDYTITPIYPANSSTDWISINIKDVSSPTYYIKNHFAEITIQNEFNNANGSDYRAAKIVFTITAAVDGKTVTYKDTTLEYTMIQGGCNYGNSLNELKTIYGSEYRTEFYVKPDNMKPYPDESTPSTPEQLIVPEGKFTSDSLTISAEGGTFWTRFDITNMTYEYYNNLVSPRGKAHSAEVTWQNEKFFSDENEWVYGKLGAVNAHLKKDRTTGKPYLYVKYNVNPNTTNYKLTSYMIYRYWGTIKGAAQINADPLFEYKIPVYQLPASDTVTKTESLPDKPVGIVGETAVGAVECGYTNTLDVFAIAEEDIKTKLNVYSTAEWMKIKDITYNKN